jgi:hypothetical protein
MPVDVDTATKMYTGFLLALTQSEETTIHQTMVLNALYKRVQQAVPGISYELMLETLLSSVLEPEQFDYLEVLSQR